LQILERVLAEQQHAEQDRSNLPGNTPHS
jgi:hypothetical protein